MKITATAATRVDLAGGTLDLHPLYLFLDNPLTVNASINLRSRAVVTPLPGSRVRLISEDLQVTAEADSPEQLTLGQDLDLLKRAVRFYAPGGGLELRTFSAAPKGSGLGASSSLLMSMSAALGKFAGRSDGIDEIIHWGGALEAQNLRIPTGLQDYYGACLGGINGLRFGVDGASVSTLHPSAEFAEQLQHSMIISFTGVSHFSGTNNWNMLKGFIDRQGDVVERMEAIRDIAQAMWEGLLEEDLQAVAQALEAEWQQRCGLAVGVTTEAIDSMMAAARQAGALASKLCGAGGGGCMLTLAAPGQRDAVCAALRQSGAQILEAALDKVGLSVQEE
ncbi:MAG: hypothetical protein Q4F00_06465 [bacterium]|nr:hypothetical protein [bacterium]